MPPADEIKRRLIALGFAPNLQDVIKVMSEYEVVIFSKEEAKVLDGTPENLYPLDGEMVPGAGMRTTGDLATRLAASGATLDPRYCHNVIL